MESNRKLVNRYDLWIIVGLLLVVAVFAFLTRRQSDAEILRGHVYVAGMPVKTLYLDGTEKSFVPSQLPAIELLVGQRGVAFIRSDCPNQICVHTGWLNRPGHFAACIPNQVLLVIVGEAEAQLDGVTR